MAKVKRAFAHTYQGVSVFHEIGEDISDEDLINSIPNKDLLFEFPEDEDEEFLPPTPGMESTNYEDMRVQDLVEKAKSRNVQITSTRKADLVNALRAADAASTPEASGDNPQQ